MTMTNQLFDLTGRVAIVTGSRVSAASRAAPGLRSAPCSA
jgi:hypothetical protein